MPRFYFNLESRAGVILDEEGAVHATAIEASEASQRIARQIMASDVGTGELDLTQRIIVRDEAGNLVATAYFASAFAFLHAEDHQMAANCPMLAQWRPAQEAGPHVLAQQGSIDDGTRHVPRPDH